MFTKEDLNKFKGIKPKVKNEADRKDYIEYIRSNLDGLTTEQLQELNK